MLLSGREHQQIDLQVKYFVELTLVPFCDLKYSEVLETNLSFSFLFFFFFHVFVYLPFANEACHIVPAGLELII